MLAGACGGIAAAFNTPLAGIVFGIEEMSQSFERRTSGLTLTTVIVAGLTSLAFLGNYTYFGTPKARLPDITDWFVIPLCGLVGGFLGGLFSRLLIRCLLGIPGRIGGLVKSRPLAFAFACGLGVALVGVATHGATFGTGYAQARGLLDNAREVSPMYGLAKIAATLLSAASGIPGGIFAPSLAVGASLGATLIAYFPNTDPNALYLLGMVSYLTGVIQAPMTAFVIVTELADAHGMIIPLMAAALVAHTISRVVCGKGIYHALAEEFMPTAEAKSG
jgi:H+/Cl- antiporter ClcA